ncbi:MAG: 16S rRNA (adenine(1518)-N(6)/adenine(1519)-N(6))-dimethyltransferase RsmA [bacterium]
MSALRRGLLSEIRKRLRDADVSPRRRWSQNFIADPRVFDRIVTAGGFQHADTVVEIGAGLGFLTQQIARHAGRMIAFEVDPRLARSLRKLMQALPHVTIVEGDFLKADLRKFGALVKVVGNIPYHITSPILEKLIDSKNVHNGILMVQQEVAERTAAGAGEPGYGRLSLFVQYTFQVEALFDIPSRAFVPQPKVTSTVVRLVRRAKPPVEVADAALFFEVIKCGFAQRRKTIQNNLKARLPVPIVERLLAESGISPQARAEGLGFEEFRRLSDALWRMRKVAPPFDIIRFDRGEER